MNRQPAVDTQVRVASVAAPVQRRWNSQHMNSAGAPSLDAAHAAHSFGEVAVFPPGGQLAIQAKLTVGPVDDAYEREADHVAQQVVSNLDAPPVQRQSGKEDEDEPLQARPAISALKRQAEPEEDDEALQTKRLVQRQADGSGDADPSLEADIQLRRGGGQALSDTTRQSMERAFGADFSQVRVHSDAHSDMLSRSIQARAFTTGQDIFMRQGEYRPTERAGKELLAHELTHVVQQAHASDIQRQPNTAPSPSFPTLQKGAQGVQVKHLQRRLNSVGLVPLRPLAEDGDFSATTELHVLELQRRNGLTADGIVGPQTWRLLNLAPSAAQTETQKKSEPTGISGDSKGLEPSWLTVARAEIGTKEIKGSQHNPRIVEYLKVTGGWWSTDETPWCSGFVNWVMKQAGYAGSGSAKAVSWLDWGKRIKQPVNGAIGVISYGGGKGHVGFVVGKQGKSILLLGGNQSDQVKISAFSLSKFAAFVVPADYTLPASSSSLQESANDYGKEASFESTR